MTISANITLPGVSQALISDALDNLWIRPSRSLLALIGIGVGTAAVIAILHVGCNARAAAMRQFEAVGADFVMIQPPSVGTTSKTMDRADINALPSKETGIMHAAPMIVSSGTVIEGREQIANTIVGAAGGLETLLHLKLEEGRFASDLDGKAPFAVIGAAVAKKIEGARQSPLVVGDQIRVSDVLLTIVGVLQSQPINPIVGIAFDDSVIVPIDAMVRFMPLPAISNVIGCLAPGVDQNAMIASTTDFFRKRLNGGVVQIELASALFDSIKLQMRIYDNLLGAITTVSLAMGGIGIMNVMLMSVMERQGEIGLRAAIGASPGAIMAMFLLESTIIALVGSAAGVVLGVITGWIFVLHSGWQFQIAFVSLPLAVGMALASGLIFGLYPAWRAASLQPIEALRRG